MMVRPGPPIGLGVTVDKRFLMEAASTVPHTRSISGLSLTTLRVQMGLKYTGLQLCLVCIVDSNFDRGDSCSRKEYIYIVLQI